MPTIVFGLVIILRSDGFATCTTANLVLALQLIRFQATVKELHVSYWDVSSLAAVVAIFGSTRANVSD